MPERTVTVKEVTGRKDVPLQHGAFVEYRFTVEEFGDELIWLRKGANPDAPSGQLTGTVEPTDRGLKFKLAPRDSTAPGGRVQIPNVVGLMPQGGEDKFARRPEHPRNEARMVRNGALSSATTLYKQLREEGLIPPPEDKAAYLKTLAGITEWLESGIREAMDRAEA